MDLSSALSVEQVMVHEPIVIAPQQSIQDAVEVMNRRNVGAILVGERGRLAGIFSERDLLLNAEKAKVGWRDRPVADWMTADPHTIAPDASWADALALMDRLHVRHLPVVEPDSRRILGLITARDLMARRNEYLNRLIEERTHDLREAYERLRKRDAELHLHMALAGRLQSRLLPLAPPTWPEIAWGIHYAPLDPLGGDYYDFAQPDEDHLGVLIADASGHSIPAAMVAIMAHAAFAQEARRIRRPGEVLTAMNRHLHGLTDERFVTAFYGILHRPSMRFTYANAGHPQPLHLDEREGSCQALAANGLMLGVLSEVEYEEHSVDLRPGDRLCLFTDGASECRGPDSTMFGTENLTASLSRCRDELPTAIAQRLVQQMDAFRGDLPQSDDLTLLIAEIRRTQTT